KGPRRGGAANDHVCGDARYGNVDENAASFAETLSVQSGSWNGGHNAPTGERNELKIAVSPRSTTSSVSFRPPPPFDNAQLNQPAEFGFFEGSTTSMSGYKTLPRVVANAAGRPKLVMKASVCGRKVAVLYGWV